MEQNHIPNPVSSEYLSSNIYQISLPKDYAFDKILAASSMTPSLIYIQISKIKEGEKNICFIECSLEEKQDSFFLITPIKKSSLSFDNHLMVGEDKFIELCPETNQILVTRPLNRTKTAYPFEYLSKCYSNVLLLYFRDTKLICIAENHKTLRLTYFSTQRFPEERTPVAVIEEEFAFRDLIQLNQHSKIGQGSSSADIYKISFRYIELQKEGEVFKAQKGEVIVTKNEVLSQGIESLQSLLKYQQVLQLQKCQFSWKLFLEYSPHRYIITIKQNNSGYLLPLKIACKTDGKASLHNFYYRIGNENKLRQQIWSRLDFNILQIDEYMIMQSICKSKSCTYYFNKGIKQSKFIGIKLKEQQCFQIVNGRTTANYHYSTDQRKGKITITEWTRKNEAFLHCLLHLNEDFDDDLLFDCIELMKEE